jgi:N-acetylglutamate synthase-like GNAT family acetyltransferase
MDIVRYEPSIHAPELEELFHQHAMSPQSFDELPRAGWIAYLGHDVLGAIFLREVEGGFGLVDGLITNPQFLGAVRHEAINRLVQRLIVEAKELRYKAVFAWIEDTGTIERSLTYGFEKLPKTMVSLDLSSKGV